MRKQKVYNALIWLSINNPCYSDLTINEEALDLLPENGVPSDVLTVETNVDI